MCFSLTDNILLLYLLVFYVTVVIPPFDGKYLKEQDISGITATTSDVMESANKELELMENELELM